MEANSIVTINSQTFAPFVSNIIFGTGQGKRPQKFATNTPGAGASGKTTQENQDWNQTNHATGIPLFFRLTVTRQLTLVKQHDTETKIHLHIPWGAAQCLEMPATN
jgi:hypothetical protein